MSIKSRAYFDDLFITGYVPTQGDYEDVFDTFMSLADDMADNTVLVREPSAAPMGLALSPSTVIGRSAAGNIVAIPFTGLGAVAKAGDTMTGLLILSADPVNVKGAVTKQYADVADAANAAAASAAQTTANNALPKAGGTMTGALILNTDPTTALGAVTKQYVDAIAQGMAPKPTATVATTAALAANTYNNGAAGVGATITITATGTLTIDGYVVALNDLVLVKNEAASANNGLYKCTTAGAGGVSAVLTRHVDMDSSAEFSGAFIPVENVGGTNANTLWLANPSGAVVVGTTAIPLTQLNPATVLVAGTGITVSGLTITANLATGKAGGQTTYGDTASGGNLTISSTFHATKGKIIIGASAYDEANNRLGIGTTSPLSRLHIAYDPIADTNKGVISLGAGAFDGSTLGFFAGSALGTVIAVNALTGYLGNLVDLQIAGVSAFSISYGGRINSRNASIASSATPTPPGDTCDMYIITALAVPATIAAPSGTPREGQELTIRIKDNGAPQSLAFNAIYRASGSMALPTTTVSGKTMYLKFKYNAVDTKWDFLSTIPDF